MKNILLLLVLAFLASMPAMGQCAGGEVEVSIEVIPDDYPNETSWNILDLDGNTVLEGDTGIETVCIEAEQCHLFTINDSYGDGICCSFGEGSYTISIDGIEVASGGDFQSNESVEFNCAAGEGCASPISIEPGDYTSSYDDSWYSFVPADNGNYAIDLCDGNACGGSIWVYDYCAGLDWDDTNAETIYSSGDDCSLEMELAGGGSYLIRIGSIDGACDGQSIDFRLIYQGEISGCTDPAACSYNPLATVNVQEECFYLPDPECLTFGNQLQLEETTLIERDVATGLDIPWEVVYGPDDHLWVTERKGRVLRIEPVTGSMTTILDIEDEMGIGGGGEPGMLGLALHPNFDSEPLVYIVYCYLDGPFTKERLSSFEWDGSELTNESYILDDLDGANIHNGSRLLITDDMKILMTRGDVANANDAQDLDNLNGKILRMNMDGSVPDDNPFPGSLVYTLGNRNAQGLTFGPDGIIFSSEHGAQSSDEFNVIEAGRNYGWPNVQGACDATAEQAFCDQFDVKEPLAEWSPCPAVNDVVYYDHPAIPEWNGKVLMAVLGGLSGGLQRISVLELSEDFDTVVNEEQYFTDFGRLRDVCINPNTGAIYIATNGPGYPGSGPNRIIEYRNYDYEIDEPPLSIGPGGNQQFAEVYPNPLGDRGYIVFSENLIGKRMELINFNGQVLMDREITSTQMHLHVTALPGGSYFLRVDGDEGLISKTIIVGK